jgi:excisionase family DNA binding protein
MSKQIAALNAARELTVQAFRTMEGVVDSAFSSIITAIQSDPAPAKDDYYMSLPDASKYTGIPLDTIYKLTSKNQITYIRPNRGKVYFKKSDLDKYMERGRIPSNDEIMGKI